MANDIYYYDIAAVAVMAASLLSFTMRCKTRTPANRVYYSALRLVTLLSVLSLGAELFDALLGTSYVAFCQTSAPAVFASRSAITLAYYELLTLTAPAYLALIATVSSTSHKLNDTVFARVTLWVPLVVVSLIVLTNPFHHLVYSFPDGVQTRGPLVGAIYASALYYSFIGIGWLFRWRAALSNDEFSTLMMLYPLVFISLVIQFYMPTLHVQMFATSVCMMLVSAFVLRPEKQLDSQVNAASLHSYRETCRRAFITQRPLCLVYLEIVNLEQLRELMGKSEMQDVLGGIATKLADSLKTGDVLHYLRNGLFCIMPQNIDAAHALHVAQQVHEQNKAQAIAQGNSGTEVRMRSCVVRAPQDVSDIQTLHTFVRRFSHLVPNSEVTTYAMLSEHDDFALQMALPSIVERAIRERSFEVYYQPILCTKDQRFHSAEALVRLHDKTYGWIPPSLFIPEAEQSGAILQIGNILLDKVCAFLGTLDCDELGLSYVEVNLSVEQCVQPQLAGEVLGYAREHGVDPSRMNLEITETSSSFSQKIIERNVRALSQAGVTFSLDDYGTGYSNVCRALRLPFSLVKFDKSFVDGLDDPATRTVLERSIAMIRDIGKEVLIEGVETPDEANALVAMGADYIQGYLYAKPIPPEEFVAFLRAQYSEA
ncbi:MAG: EAL domain-containing protein [Coriobacteriales bacterium]|nr:EAL domain-containing protein [Coriobacteriales bacterium]